MKIPHLYILGCLLSGAVLSSCNLDITPENTLAESNAFETERELNSTTAAMHFALNSVAASNLVHMQIGLKADEVNNATELRLGNPKVILNDEQDWKGLYDVIYFANTLRENYQHAQMSEERNNFHLGQANFCAGLAYFLLAQRYGDCIITTGAKDIVEYQTSPAIKVVETAIEYAKEAYTQLPVSKNLKGYDGNLLTDKQWASKGACAALLSHLYAWKGSIIELYGLPGDAKQAYEESVKYATDIIEQKVGNYALVSTPNELCELFTKGAGMNPEVIYSISFDEHRSTSTVSPNEVASIFLSYPVKETDLLGDIISNTTARLYTSTVKEMYPDENDQRRDAFFYKLNEAHEVDGKDYALTYKFRRCLYEKDEYSADGRSFRSVYADYILWRLADLILLRAECEAKLGHMDKAIADMNVVRARAGAAPYPTATDSRDVRFAVFKERERELIAESDGRYYDIIRNNYIRTELGGNFQTFTPQQIKDGALYLPISSSAYTDKYGAITNRKLRQNNYWSLFIK